MKLTNDSYLILLSGKAWAEDYYRDREGRLKVSALRREFRMTIEQVLDHVLPALVGLKPTSRSRRSIADLRPMRELGWAAAAGSIASKPHG
jgi:hypothetical protein